MPSSIFHWLYRNTFGCQLYLSRFYLPLSTSFEPPTLFHPLRERKWALPTFRREFYRAPFYCHIYLLVLDKAIAIRLSIPIINMPFRKLFSLCAASLSAFIICSNLIASSLVIVSFLNLSKSIPSSSSRFPIFSSFIKRSIYDLFCSNRTFNWPSILATLSLNSAVSALTMRLIQGNKAHIKSNNGMRTERMIVHVSIVNSINSISHFCQCNRVFMANSPKRDFIRERF